MIKKLDEHNDLMGKMADRAKVNLGDALIEGRLDASRYRGSVIRCSRCQSSETCKALLAAEEGKAGEVPDYCANKALFAEMGEGNQ